MNSNPHIFSIGEIEQALLSDFDAVTAHQKFSHKQRSLLIPEDIQSVKESAVILLLFENNNQLNLCLTLRNKNLKHHPGQISFPGGRINPDEDNPIAAALREFHEETGANPSDIKILGQLSDLYIPVSNFLIHPVVGYLGYQPTFEINTTEVEKIFSIPLPEFFNNSNIAYPSIDTSFGKINVPAFVINGYTIWGATAMIISELVARLTT